MTRTQKWIVGAVDYPDSLFEEQVLIHSACGYIRGIPMSMIYQAQIESWTLPHVYTETWEDPVPEQP